MGIQEKEKPFNISDWTILSAAEKHVPQIAYLHSFIFDESWDANFLTKLLNQTTSISYVATSGSSLNVKGFLLGCLAADQAEILSLAVDKHYRGQGMARALLAEFTKEVREKLGHSIFLEVSVKNISAQNFYKKSGFQIIGHRRKYYDNKNDTPCDAISLSLSLKQVD